MATVAPKKTLESFKPGTAACQVKPNGFYVTGETLHVRELCMAGSWKQAVVAMTTNLCKRFKATPEYANWWAKSTIKRYQRDGVPAPPRRRGPSPDDNTNPRTDTPPQAGAGSKRTASGATKAAAAAATAAKKDITALDVVSLVMQSGSGGTFAYGNNGSLVISFNGVEMYNGTPADADAVKALYDDIKALINLKPRADKLHSELESARAAMASFLETNKDKLQNMGISTASFVDDAEDARAQLALAKQRINILERSETASLAKIIQLGNELENAMKKAEAVDEEDESDDEEAGSDEEAEEDEEPEAGSDEEPEAGADEEPEAGADEQEAEEPAAKRPRAEFELSEDEA